MSANLLIEADACSKAQGAPFHEPVDGNSTEQTLADLKAAERRLQLQYTLSKTLAEAALLSEGFKLVLAAICDQGEWDAGTVWIADGDVLRVAEWRDCS